MSEARQTAKYPIGTVARVTGISTHTLRVWERRYGAVEPARTRGGSRVYSDLDVDKLRLLKKLTELGYAIGQIAHLPLDQLRPMAEPERGAETSDMVRMAEDVAETTRQRFLAALQELDVTTAERTLLYAASFFEPRDLVLRIVAPIIQDIGALWERGALRIAHEHAASALLRNLLGTLIRTRPSQPGAATAVATTLSGELHEFGVLMAGLMAAVHGWKVLYLGPSLPADEILHVIEQSDAAALLLSIVDARNDHAERELRALVGRLPPDVELIAGGQGARAYTDVLGRAILATDLVTLEPLLANARH